MHLLMVRTSLVDDIPTRPFGMPNEGVAHRKLKNRVRTEA